MGKKDLLKGHPPTQFPNQDPTRGGRPKKIYTILKEKGYSKDDIKTAFLEISWYDEEEILKVKKDKTKPQIIRIIANQMHEALKKGDWNKIKEIMEHTIGKPVQKLSNDEDSPLINQTTPVVLSDGRTIEDVLKELK